MRSRFPHHKIPVRQAAVTRPGDRIVRLKAVLHALRWFHAIAVPIIAARTYCMSLHVRVRAYARGANDENAHEAHESEFKRPRRRFLNVSFNGFGRSLR